MTGTGEGTLYFWQHELCCIVESWTQLTLEVELCKALPADHELPTTCIGHRAVVHPIDVLHGGGAIYGSCTAGRNRSEEHGVSFFYKQTGASCLVCLHCEAQILPYTVLS